MGTQILTRFRYYVDYFTPREILGTMIIVFSGENVVNKLIQWYVPPEHEFTAWSIIFILSVIVAGYWGEVDEDMEELEEEIDKIEEEKSKR